MVQHRVGDNVAYVIQDLHRELYEKINYSDSEEDMESKLRQFHTVY